MKCLALVAAVVSLALGCSVPQPLPAGASSEKALTSFATVDPPASAVVDEQGKSISLELPAGTPLSSLVALFDTTGASVAVNGVLQASGVTANDFSLPVSYVVRAEDGSTATYVVTATTRRPLSADKSITAFAVLRPAAAGEIDEPGRAISVTVPHGTEVSSLVAVYAITGARVTVDDTEQESGVTVNDFSEPKGYVVQAEDGTTTTYTVTVESLPSAEKAFTSFEILSPSAPGVIDQEGRVIRVRLPPGTPLAALVAKFSVNGVSVTVNGLRQESGITVGDFSQPVEYVVHAEDGSCASYSIRVVGTMDCVVNELDVDQVGADTAEYIELFARAEIDLFGMVLALVNGGVTPGQEYARIELGPVGILAAGSYLVIAGSSVPVAPGARKYTPPGWESSNRIQNGPNDAVILFDTLGKRIVDTVTYNGVLHRAALAGETGEWDATEGATGAPADSNSTTGSLSRIPNGQDTGGNGADFKLTPTLTPGAPNTQ
jgi:hypothetical protein